MRPIKNLANIDVVETKSACRAFGVTAVTGHLSFNVNLYYAMGAFLLHMPRAEELLCRCQVLHLKTPPF